MRIQQRKQNRFDMEMESNESLDAQIMPASPSSLSSSPSSSSPMKPGNQRTIMIVVICLLVAVAVTGIVLAIYYGVKSTQKATTEPTGTGPKFAGFTSDGSTYAWCVRTIYRIAWSNQGVLGAFSEWSSEAFSLTETWPKFTFTRPSSIWSIVIERQRLDTNEIQDITESAYFENSTSFVDVSNPCSALTVPPKADTPVFASFDTTPSVFPGTPQFGAWRLGGAWSATSYAVSLVSPVRFSPWSNFFQSTTNANVSLTVANVNGRNLIFKRRYSPEDTVGADIVLKYNAAADQYYDDTSPFPGTPQFRDWFDTGFWRKTSYSVQLANFPTVWSPWTDFVYSSTDSSPIFFVPNTGGRQLRFKRRTDAFDLNGSIVEMNAGYDPGTVIDPVSACILTVTSQNNQLVVYYTAATPQRVQITLPLGTQQLLSLATYIVTAINQVAGGTSAQLLYDAALDKINFSILNAASGFVYRIRTSSNRNYVSPNVGDPNLANPLLGYTAENVTTTTPCNPRTFELAPSRPAWS